MTREEATARLVSLANSGLSSMQQAWVRSLCRAGGYFYVNNPLFHSDQAEDLCARVNVVPVADASARVTKDQERALFLRFNYTRYRVCQVFESTPGDPGVAWPQELWNWCQRADDERNAIIRTYEWLVGFWLKEFRRTRIRDVRIDMAAIRGGAYDGLNAAVDKFDVDGGACFSTWAKRPIGWGILHAWEEEIDQQQAGPPSGPKKGRKDERPDAEPPPRARLVSFIPGVSQPANEVAPDPSQEVSDSEFERWLISLCRPIAENLGAEIPQVDVRAVASILRQIAGDGQTPAPQSRGMPGFASSSEARVLFERDWMRYWAL